MRRYVVVIAASAVVGLIVLSFSQTLSAQKKSQYWQGRYAKYVEIPGATRVGTEACAACHTEIAGNYRHAFHMQQGVECEDCHGAGSLHVQGSGDVAKIVSFGARAAEEANGACLSCHAQDQRIRHWLAGPHASNQVRCTECHEIHGQQTAAKTPARMSFDTEGPGRSTAAQSLVPESEVLLRPRWQTNDACLKCHQAQRAQMNLPYHHPLREGKFSCVDCHDPHGGAAGNNLRMANTNELCLNCHAQYRGPFTYQHPPVTESCLKCHMPHGSPNTNLLKVSEPALCYQCHAGHHNGTGLPLADRCTNCHGSIHGTDVASATGGSVFIDKGNAGLPDPPPAGFRGKLAASHASGLSRMGGPAGGAFAAAISGLLAQMNGGSVSSAAGSGVPDTFTAFSVIPGAYRLIDKTGFMGRVGEYDSLQQSAGGEVASAYVAVPSHIVAVSRASILTGNDYYIASQVAAGDWLRAGLDLRSFFQQQDNYPFYANVISPDIVTSPSISSGSVFGIKRRLGSGYGRFKVPKLPVHLFVKGDWQARVGTSQFAWFDMGGDSGCNSCHFTSEFQGVNYTTRNVSGGAEVNVGPVDMTWEHRFSSFSDRLQFPAGAFGATLMELEPVAGVADTLPGTYALDLPAPNQSSADSLRANWTASPRLQFNGEVSYTRGRDLFTQNTRNAFDANTRLNWHPLGRLRFTANYGQQNLLNEFTPFYTLFGNVSYHQHQAGVRMEYDLFKQLELETRYERQGISRSNSALWPQSYSIDNTDLHYVIPLSSSNTTGLALRYHGRERWSARAGYDWTGTHEPGFLTDPKSNNRIFADFTLSPTNWLVFTNDTSVIVQNAFPVIERRNRFYADTAAATLLFAPDWNLELGYSYQQNNLATYMAMQNDPAVGYVLQEPFLPYKQLSQTVWGQLATTSFQRRLGFNARVAYNSAHSGMQPDLDPNHFAQLGNASLFQQGLFDPVMFQQALDALSFGSTQVSQVIVHEWTGQAKVYYVFPHKFEGGLVFYYGGYQDFVNSNLNGVLRTFNIYVGRSW